MKRYEIWEHFWNGCWGCIKSYPFKLQAIIWCVLNGYVYQNGFGRPFLDPKIKIKEVKDEK